MHELKTHVSCPLGLSHRGLSRFIRNTKFQSALVKSGTTIFVLRNNVSFSYGQSFDCLQVSLMNVSVQRGTVKAGLGIDVQLSRAETECIR